MQFLFPIPSTVLEIFSGLSFLFSVIYKSAVYLCFMMSKFSFVTFFSASGYLAFLYTFSLSLLYFPHITEIIGHFICNYNGRLQLQKSSCACIRSRYWVDNMSLKIVIILRCGFSSLSFFMTILLYWMEGELVQNRFDMTYRNSCTFLSMQNVYIRISPW